MGDSDRNAIVVVAYKRLRSLNRLLASLAAAEFAEPVDLVISIDSSSEQELVAESVYTFNWEFGEKIVHKQTRQLGLREHVLRCGDWTEGYSAVVMLEDDIIVARSFYRYVQQALDYFVDDNRVAGLSLYAPMINEMAERPFSPDFSGNDVYFVQSAQSWGQCWSRPMWQAFRRWYARNDGPLRSSGDLPPKVYSWPDSSWKKYFMKYLIESDTYFVYPYRSLSSNAGEVGAHNRFLSNRYQVPLDEGFRDYDFCSLSSGVVYDSFFERINLSFRLDGSEIGGDLCLDLYGTRKDSRGCRFLASTAKMPLPVRGTIALSRRPHESNLIHNEKGHGIFIYDCGAGGNASLPAKKVPFAAFEYYCSSPWRISLPSGFAGLWRVFRKRFRKWIRKLKPS